MYFQSLAVTVGMAVISLAMLLIEQSIKLERLFPFYQMMREISVGIFNKDADKLAEAQRAISTPPKDLSIGFLERHYGDNFGRYKELKRAMNNYPMVINTLILSSCFVCLGIYINLGWMYATVMAILIIVLANFLSLLNREEAKLIAAGIYLPFTIKEWLGQKYLVQFGITLLLLFPTLFIISHIGVVPYVILMLMIPLKSILQYFLPQNLKTKVLRFVMDFIALALCYLSYTVETLNAIM